jgi:hypothetical protein
MLGDSGVGKTSILSRWGGRNDDSMVWLNNIYFFPFPSLILPTWNVSGGFDVVILLRCRPLA